jgi:hypothetical protein
MVFVVPIIVLAFSALVLGVDKMFLNRAFFRRSLVDSELRGIRNGESARRPMPHTFCLFAKLYYSNKKYAALGETPALLGRSYAQQRRLNITGNWQPESGNGCSILLAGN